MSRYYRCPNCLKWVMPWYRYCSRCGNNLEFNTVVCEKVRKERKRKVEKLLR